MSADPTPVSSETKREAVSRLLEQLHAAPKIPHSAGGWIPQDAGQRETDTLSKLWMAEANVAFLIDRANRLTEIVNAYQALVAELDADIEALESVTPGNETSL